jgi:hypothetical protein
MRWKMAAAIFCLTAVWAGGVEADGCRCPPSPVRHRHAVHVFRHYAATGCPIALAHEIRSGCDWYYHQVRPID